ncbi:hypothetical protein ACP70R_012824 [Stipagrostis hirtigluma subsp. patula]
MEKPLAPKYVKMPGRPRKERRREPHEKPKTTRLSRRGTVIRCRKCKQTGHNSTTCNRWNSPNMAASDSGVGASHSNFGPISSPNAMVPLPLSQQSATSSMKRKEPSTSTAGGSKSKKKCTGVGVLYSEKTGTTIQNSK